METNSQEFNLELSAKATYIIHMLDEGEQISLSDFGDGARFDTDVYNELLHYRLIEEENGRG
jgi:hypothetical protein